MKTSRREKLLLGLILILLIFTILNFYLDKVSTSEEDEFLEEDLFQESKEEELREIEELSIIVHVGGAVKNPGIIELNPGSRVIDAINLVGGSLEDADLDSINLARRLDDEEKIYIAFLADEPIINQTYDAYYNKEDIKININNCSREDLISLPGIGEKTAEKILNYRETSRFKSIEDIMNVSGIGEKKFEAIEGLIITK